MQAGMKMRPTNMEIEVREESTSPVVVKSSCFIFTIEQSRNSR